MGRELTCTRYKVVMARSAAGNRKALRCVNFESSNSVGKHPRCPAGTSKKLTGNSGMGRSPGLIRVVGCKRPAGGSKWVSHAKKTRKSRKAAKARRKSKR